MSALNITRNFRHNWSIWFAVFVALWFLVAGAKNAATNSLDSQDFFKNKNETTTSTIPAQSARNSQSQPETIVGPLTLKLIDFALDKNSTTSTYDADITLELKTSTAENVTFSPTSFTLSNGKTILKPTETAIMEVTPKFAVTVPLTFKLSGLPGTDYKLSYSGHLLYSGSP